jgi:hypothetical protein
MQEEVEGVLVLLDTLGTGQESGGGGNGGKFDSDPAQLQEQLILEVEVEEEILVHL